MKLSDFKYNLPKTAIAKFPVSPRDKAKLMVLTGKLRKLKIKIFQMLLIIWKRGVLAVNETRVFQARLYGKKEKTNAKIEVFLSGN